MIKSYNFFLFLFLIKLHATETHNTDNQIHDRKSNHLQKSYEKLCIINSEESAKTLAFLNEEKTTLLIYKINPINTEIVEKNLKQYGIEPKNILSVYIRESTIQSLKRMCTLFPFIRNITLQNNTIQVLDLINEKNTDIAITIESNRISLGVDQELKELEKTSLNKLVQGNNTISN